MPARSKTARSIREKPVRQSVTIPVPLVAQVRRVAKERNLTMSRALVSLAERGIQADLEAKEKLRAAYRRFMGEQEPARKTKRAGIWCAPSLGRAPLPKIRFFELPSGLWWHLLDRVQEREISLSHPGEAAAMGQVRAVCVRWRLVQRLRLI
jgi:hypothetical protein